MVLAPSSKKQMVTNIDQWMSAFQTYVATYATRSPGDTPALMKFATVIRELATSGDNWKFYDENFRKLRESQGAPWDQIHLELWQRSQSFRTTTGELNRELNMIPKGFAGGSVRVSIVQDAPINTSASTVEIPILLPNASNQNLPGAMGKNLLLPPTEALPTPVRVKRLLFYLRHLPDGKCS